MGLICDLFEGHYMTINADYIAQHTSSSSSHTMRLVSPTFEPAPNYCIRFWYNTHGVDVQPLKVYAKVTLPVYSFFFSFLRVNSHLNHYIKIDKYFIFVGRQNIQNYDLPAHVD